MRRLRGAPASSGIARGPAVRLAARPRPTGRRIEPEEAPAELRRLAEAVEQAATALEALGASVTADGHPAEGEIFGAQAAMARDPALATLASARIEGGEDAIGAIQAAGTELADQLRGLGDELLAARAADVEDVVSRIADHLAGVGPGPSLDRPAVVVADDLPPSLTASLPRDRLLGMALESGSPTAHAAILARAYGIPAVVGIPGLLDVVADLGDQPEIVVDGDAGEVVVEPDPSIEAELRDRIAAATRAADEARAEADLPAVTLDGTEIMLLANIGTPGESAHAIELGARGVGLFRTEFLFLERAAPPSEDEQVLAYRDVVEAFRPHPVTIRLLDVGGDKPIPYLPIPAEANPFLGVRALRLAPDQPGLFVTQLRAAMRAAAPGADAGAGDGAGGSGARGAGVGVAEGGAAVPIGAVKVMAPMVADATDVELLVSLADRARSELEAAGIPHGPIVLGVMLEIPSAILVGDSYFSSLGFASLGTNDLLQYAVAVDRGNRRLARYQDSLHPALLRLVREAVERAHRARIELSVCGEMAGDPVAALALVGLGIRSLSMAASSLAPVRRAIRGVSLERLERETSAALESRTAVEIRERFATLAARG